MKPISIEEVKNEEMKSENKIESRGGAPDHLVHCGGNTVIRCGNNTVIRC